LNALPEVRQIIKELGHADTYARLNANFIPGHNPDIVFSIGMAKKSSVWISEGMALSEFRSFCRRKGSSEHCSLIQGRDQDKFGRTVKSAT